MAFRWWSCNASAAAKLLPDVDVRMFNAQYKNSLPVKASGRFHDRYFIIDRKTLVHIGASLNYFGKKCFACSTFDPIDIPEMLAKLEMQGGSKTVAFVEVLEISHYRETTQNDIIFLFSY